MALEITLYEYGPSRSKHARWTLLECGLEFKSVSGIEILHSDELKKVTFFNLPRVEANIANLKVNWPDELISLNTC